MRVYVRPGLGGGFPQEGAAPSSPGLRPDQAGSGVPANWVGLGPRGSLWGAVANCSVSQEQKSIVRWRVTAFSSLWLED